MHRYDLVIFDFDGTLADSFPWFLATINGVADEFGFRRFDVARLDEIRSLSARELMARSGLRWWRVPAVAQRMRTLMSAQIERIALFDGVAELLAQLAQAGVQLALVTSNSHANVARVLGPALLAQFRDVRCGAAVLGKRRKLRASLRACGVPAARALCVGDEIRDAEAARQAGIAFAGVTWGYTLPTALQPHTPLPLLQRPEALRALVLGADDRTQPPALQADACGTCAAMGSNA
ncbi:N-acetylmuramic acid 6-phosphate phosphatase [Xanthomonas sacchari]|uniref:HAD hydrolase-like protein n=1 Tax=Xanthomonas sacchari TaxID=56458 RepID=UPI00225C187D|nr:HAD hydrolase-like protein [Xanthomonas sacchari]MCW0388358.1 N-acetylmuramic acid 6-phosphate phosphatase [Xanthomonas sacchari]